MSARAHAWNMLIFKTIFSLNILMLYAYKKKTVPYLKIFKKQKRGLELVSLSHFLHNVWRKIFVTLYFINLLNFILSLLLEILDNMCIVINFCPVCDVTNSEINLSFPIKPFFYITKTCGRKCICLKNKKSF